VNRVQTVPYPIPSFREIWRMLVPSERNRAMDSRSTILFGLASGLKRVIRPMRGFQTMRTAYATIKGFEIMRMIRRRHCFLCKPRVEGEIQFVNKLFDIAA
jgi:transposase-like protein